jgi:DNA-binding transcriptional LysR family regulator
LFDDLLKGLDTRAMDAVIGVLDARAHQPQLAHHVLFDDHVSIVIGQGSKHWDSEQPPCFADLLREQWVMPPLGTLTRIQMDAYLIEQQASWLVPKAETASLAMMQALLQKGDYVGVCAESMADHLASLGLLKKIAIDSHIRFGPITVVWNREHISATLMDFIDCLKAHARSLPVAPVQAPPSA